MFQGLLTTQERRERNLVLSLLAALWYSYCICIQILLESLISMSLSQQLSVKTDRVTVRKVLSPKVEELQPNSWSLVLWPSSATWLAFKGRLVEMKPVLHCLQSISVPSLNPGASISTVNRQSTGKVSPCS